MRRIIILISLIVTLLIGGVSIEAKTSKKKRSKGSSAQVIGKFTDGSTVYTMYSNGKIKTTNKCLTGSYKKGENGSFYTVYLWTTGTGSNNCGDGAWVYMIAEDNVYAMGYGTDGSGIEDFTYNPNYKLVTVYNNSGYPDDEFMMVNDLPAFTMPLSHFVKLGTVQWTK